MSKSQPLVSVIVICFNQEAFIEECLQSILNQRCDFPFEIIVSDDASSDDTFKIVEEIGRDEPQIKLLNTTENKGPAGNFLKALQHVTGEFIAFCEGDDYWSSPQKLQAQVEALRENDTSSFCYADYAKVDEKGVVMSDSCLPQQPTSFGIRDLLQSHGPVMNSLMVRRDVFPKKIPLDFFKVLNPDVFIIAWSIEPGKGVFLNEVLSTYRIQSSGIWSNRSQFEKDLVRYSTFSVVLRNLRKSYPDLERDVSSQLFHLLSSAKKKGYLKLYEEHFALMSPKQKIKYRALLIYHGFRS